MGFERPTSGSSFWFASYLWVSWTGGAGTFEWGGPDATFTTPEPALRNTTRIGYVPPVTVCLNRLESNPRWAIVIRSPTVTYWLDAARVR